MGLHKASVVLLVGALVACGGAPPPTSAAPEGRASENGQETPAKSPPPASSEALAAPRSTADAAGSQGAPLEGSAKADGATAAEPRVLSIPDLAESPGARELEAGAESVRKEAWITAQKQLGDALTALAKGGPTEALMVGYALLGRSCKMGRSAECAERSYQKVLELWKQAEGAKSAEARDRAVLAAAEALTFVADQRRAALEAVRMPFYRGKDTREEVSAFVSSDVAAFIEKKKPLLDEADAAYGRVFDLKPLPAQAAVAAASRMASMRGRFTAELRAAPIPEAWKRKGNVPGATMTYEELRAFYYESLDELSKPLRARARQAYEGCAQRATRLGVESEYARTCRVWLEKNQGAGEARSPEPLLHSGR